MAIGLEIEVPVPIDKLTNVNVLSIQNKYAGNPNANHPHIVIFTTWGYIEKNGKVPYGVIFHDSADDKGFRAEADHDDRVLEKNAWPPREGGYDSIMEIVTDPPCDTEAQFSTVIDNIKDWLKTDVSDITQKMTRRGQVGRTVGLKQNYNIYCGPLIYDGEEGEGVRIKDRHNLKGSVQVNIGIDLREYHSLLKWYNNSEYSNPSRENDKTMRSLLQHIRDDIQKAIKIGKEIAGHYRGQATKNVRNEAGNFRGMRGWITHMALYVVRSKRSNELNGSIKNLVPALMKTPNNIAALYGMTEKEKEIYQANRKAIMKTICLKAGRMSIWNDAGWKNRNICQGFYDKNGEVEITLDELSDIDANHCHLTGGPIKDPTAVGPRRNGNDSVKNITSIIIHGVSKRGGVVVEYRTLAGYYKGTGEWKKMGQDFLREATARNTRNGIAV